MIQFVYKAFSYLQHPAQSWSEFYFDYRSRKLIDIIRGVKLPKTNGGVIVFANVRNTTFYTLFDFTLALIFAQMGYRCTILLDDGCLSHHDAILPTNNAFSNALRQIKDHREQLKQKGRTVSGCPHQMVSHPNVEFVFYSDMVPPSYIQAETTTSDSGQPHPTLSKHVLASHYRFFGGRAFCPTNPLHVEYSERSRHNERISQFVANHVIKHFQPNLLIALDGVYSIHGPLIDIMKARQIPVRIYQPNGFQDRELYIGDSHFGVYQGTSHWNHFKNDVYNDDLDRQTDSFLNGRIVQRIRHPTDVDQKWSQVIQERAANVSKTVALFPNLTWDGAIADRNIIFNGLQDWLEQTIKWSRNRKILLIIREHPQSKDIHSPFHSTLAMLRESITDLDQQSNLLLIPATAAVYSGFLIDQVIDLSVVYNGTLGVEIPYLGKPVVFAGKSPYANKGIGEEPDSREAYFTLLETFSVDRRLCLDARETLIRRARQAAAFQFVYNSYFCPFMPKLKDQKKPNKYVQHWDLRPSSLDPLSNTDWMRTIQRFLEPFNDPISNIESESDDASKSTLSRLNG